MEEPSVDPAEIESPEAAVEAAPEGALAALKQRWVLIAIGVLALLTLMVVGMVAFKASTAHRKDAAAQEEKREVSGAVRMAEAIAARKESLKAHRAIMEHSPSAEQLAQPPATEQAAAEEKEKAPATTVAPPPEPPHAPLQVAAIAREEPPAAAAPLARPAKRAENKAAGLPATAGNCMLSGRAAEDYGQALSRCLQDFNRLDGRSR